ncbi:3-isopropylmalate dehydratase small subunit [Leptospira interrogans]|uniref:3-isopropylmalate dehydratase small subunit n=1 Tax=Leptospira interrogans serovar Australis str. 200703203 TaxID=1085541 RepID=N1USB3_LEPIR|nr:3-isopropylmalate dehydratase small subunit [Leptospira interrogans]EMY24780.1 3-isopropylmalate dehydratase, small subunit [Leptospira interrogans serovar Australis str. 200703203]MCR8649595.1 3-isopropylmalate dehydratase small subunit [Leptospira interrogans serovar Bataviae]OAM86149.1 isopropylmalate isomerase [Leptospira interrogans serovar Bataviae]QOI40819.1 3-isopropylmalate dehydratase small subunit [Leptospira interrogans serovar Bataviae]QYY62638.1 3-isopropylmalate dehydratase s
MSRAWTKHKGIAVPLYRKDIDTDQILPKQFMKKTERTGFGVHLFHNWRYTDEAGRIPDSNFVLNQPRYKGASVLIAGENFGCGSSREHAPWSLADYGFKVVVAPSFADIFFGNCAKNGIVLVRLSFEEVEEIIQYVSENTGAEISVDLGMLILGLGNKKYNFNLLESFANRIRNGWDDIDLTKKHIQKIELFESVLQ